MSLIHCNTPDSVVLAISQWPDPDFPWAITALVPGMSEEELEDALDYAADKWRRTCGIKPRKTNNGNEARLLVTCRAIDGPSGVLAECELPTGQRRVRLWLDVGELWNKVIPSARAIGLASVLWHEMGHAIGLGHAQAGSQNIMAPQLNEQISVPGVFDTNESQRRYGKPVLLPGPPTPTPTPVPPAPGGNMGFLGNLLMSMLKNWLEKAIADGTLQKFLEDLLQKFLNPAKPVVTADDLVAALTESATTAKLVA